MEENQCENSGLTGWLHRLTPMLPVLVYIAITVGLGLPALLHLNKVIYGYESDSSLWLWTIWWRKFSFLHGLPYQFVSYAQAPFGTDQALHVYAGTLWSTAILSIPFGEIAAYNIMRLLAYVFSSTLTFLLAFRLTHNRLASFVAGLVFAFSPYGVASAQMHVDVAPIWVVPLFFLTLVSFRNRPSVRSAGAIGVAFAIAFYTTIYYSYHIAVAVVVFVIFERAERYRAGGWGKVVDRRVWLLYGVAGFIGVILSLPEMIPILHEIRSGPTTLLRTANPLIRPGEWHFLLSSRPWDFLIPPQTNPLLGGISQTIYDSIHQFQRSDFTPAYLEARYPLLDTWWFTQPASDAPSNDLYLGYANLALSGYALFLWRQRRFLESDQGKLSRTAAFWIPFLVVVFIVAFLFSLPPYIPIGGFLRAISPRLDDILIPMPALLTMLFLSPLRIARRFIVLMLLSLAILVAYAIRDLQQRMHKRARFVLVMAGCLAMMLVEYVHIEPYTPAPIPQEEHIWLKQQPLGTTAIFYPFSDWRQAMLQKDYEQPIVNTIAIDANFTFDRIFDLQSGAVGSINAPGTASFLSAMGIDYVIDTDISHLQDISGLTPIFSTDTAHVYEVTADPIPLAVLYTLRDGLWLSDAEWNWQDEQYTITIWNPVGSTLHVTISVPVRSQQGNVQLAASRELTPYPEKISWSGIVVDNPDHAEAYSLQPVIARPTEQGYEFRSMEIRPGETTLRLSWSEPLLDGTYPQSGRITLGVDEDLP